MHSAAQFVALRLARRCRAAQPPPNLPLQAEGGAIQVGSAPDAGSAERIALETFDAKAFELRRSRHRSDGLRAASARMPEGNGPADPPLRHSTRTTHKARCGTEHRKGRFRWRDFRPDTTT